MNYPKISVVTPSYNQGKYLEKTILSVINQNYPNLEYIIMDGGSTDNSVEIIKKYETKLTYWQSKPDGGQSIAINEGFRHASGEIYCWLNSDDQFYENALMTVGEYFSNNTDCQWLSGRGILRYKKDKITSPTKLDYYTISSLKTLIPQPSVFWQTEIWENCGNLNENLFLAFDIDLWLRFSKVSEGLILNEIFSIAEMHKDQKTHLYQAEYFVEFCLALFMLGEKELAIKKLARPIRRAAEADKLFSFITKNRLYRYWRGRKEERG